MRGDDAGQPGVFTYISPEERVPLDHPLRPIREMVDRALKELSPLFESLYSRFGRPSIAPKKSLRALLLQVLYAVRGERMLMEQLDYNLLLRWFIGLNMETPGSNQRWCSDGFNIPCWSGETVQVAFALDCHDREVLDHVAQATALNGSDVRLLLDGSIWARIGEAALRAPVQIQFLSGNRGLYISVETVLYAEALGFKPITTPVYSPESNGLAEAFVNTIKRDYVEGAGLSDARTVLRQLPECFHDYNESAFHSSLGFLSPEEFRAKQ